MVTLETNYFLLFLKTGHEFRKQFRARRHSIIFSVVVFLYNEHMRNVSHPHSLKHSVKERIFS